MPLGTNLKTLHVQNGQGWLGGFDAEISVFEEEAQAAFEFSVKGVGGYKGLNSYSLLLNAQYTSIDFYLSIFNI